MVRSTWGWLGFKSIGVEHERPPRYGGASTFSIVTTANFAYRGILASSFKLLKVFPAVGFLLAAVSFVALIVFVVQALVFGVPFPGFGTLASLIALLFGFLFLFLGIVAEYVGMIFTESRGRPLYVIRRTLGVPVLEDRRQLPRWDGGPTISQRGRVESQVTRDGWRVGEP